MTTALLKIKVENGRGTKRQLAEKGNCNEAAGDDFFASTQAPPTYKPSCFPQHSLTPLPSRQKTKPCRSL